MTRSWLENTTLPYERTSNNKIRMIGGGIAGIAKHGRRKAQGTPRNPSFTGTGDKG